MLDTFLATLSPMMVMFICIIIGFALHKGKIIPENTTSVLSKLEVNVFLPALVLSSFINNCTVESITANYRLVLYGTVALAIALVIGIPLASLFAKETVLRNIYRYSLVIANCGFLGNAVAGQVLGQEGLYLYILFYLPLQVCIYTWGMCMLVPGKKGNVLKNLLNPSVFALAIGLILGLTGIGKMLPGFVTTTLGNLGNCMGPVAMILTGAVIGSYDIPQLLKNKKVYIVAFLRLFILPAIIMAALWLLGADKMTLILTLFAFGSALGLNTVVFPAAYGGDTRTGASMAMISHAGAVISIPLLYALLNWIL